MTTVIIKDNSIQAKMFVEYARTLPFITVVEDKHKNFKEAATACNAVSVDAFFDELNARIEKWPDNA